MKKRMFLGALSILIITFLAIWGYGEKVKPMLRLKELADDMKQNIHLTVNKNGSEEGSINYDVVSNLIQGEYKGINYIYVPKDKEIYISILDISKKWSGVDIQKIGEISGIEDKYITGEQISKLEKMFPGVIGEDIDDWRNLSNIVAMFSESNVTIKTVSNDNFKLDDWSNEFYYYTLMENNTGNDEETSSLYLAIPKEKKIREFKVIEKNKEGITSYEIKYEEKKNIQINEPLSSQILSDNVITLIQKLLEMLDKISG